MRLNGIMNHLKITDLSLFLVEKWWEKDTPICVKVDQKEKFIRK